MDGRLNVITREKGAHLSTHDTVPDVPHIHPAIFEEHAEVTFRFVVVQVAFDLGRDGDLVLFVDRGKVTKASHDAAVHEFAVLL